MPKTCLLRWRHGVKPMLELTDAQLTQVLAMVQLRLPHAAAAAFGSRVRNWPYGRGAKPYSDLDIALFGLSKSDDTALAHLRADLEESALPWRVDLSDARDLSPALRALVLAHGVTLQKAAVPAPH